MFRIFHGRKKIAQITEEEWLAVKCKLDGLDIDCPVSVNCPVRAAWPDFSRRFDEIVSAVKDSNRKLEIVKKMHG